MKQSRRKQNALPTLAEQFGRRLQEILQERGLRLEEIANAELRFPTLNSWMFGYRFPRPRYMVTLAKALKMTPDELLKGVNVPLRIRADIDAIARADKSPG